MSGALKHFFDTIFLEAGGALSDDGSAAAAGGGRKPYGLWVHGRYDTTGAVRSVQSIVQALPWTQSAPVLDVLGDVGEEQRRRGVRARRHARRVAGVGACVSWRVALALAGLLVSGCSGDDPPDPAADSSTTAAPTAVVRTPPPKPPKNGRCYRLSFDEALAPIADDDTVKCRRKHTSQTFKVGRIDRGRRGRLRPGPATGTRDVPRQARRLPRRRRRGTAALAAGVGVVHADAGGGRGGRTVVPLRRDRDCGREPTHAAAPRREASFGDFALCATAEPGRKDSRRVPCSGQHAWRALATVDLAGSSYPLRRRSRTPCRTPAAPAPARPPTTRSTSRGARSGRAVRSGRPVSGTGSAGCRSSRPQCGTPVPADDTWLPR